MQNPYEHDNNDRGYVETAQYDDSGGQRVEYDRRNAVGEQRVEYGQNDPVEGQYAGYGQQQPYYQPPAGDPGENEATICLVFGILSIFLFPIIGGIVSIVKYNKYKMVGNGMNASKATAGRILGIVGLCLGIVKLFIIFITLFSISTLIFSGPIGMGPISGTTL